MEQQVTRSAKTAKHSLRRLTDSSSRFELLEKKAQEFMSQLSEMKRARESAPAKSSSQQREEKALEARGCLLGRKLDLLRRLESLNCGLEMMTRKVADTQGYITNMVTGLH